MIRRCKYCFAIQLSRLVALLTRRQVSETKRAHRRIIAQMQLLLARNAARGSVARPRTESQSRASRPAGRVVIPAELIYLAPRESPRERRAKTALATDDAKREAKGERGEKKKVGGGKLIEIFSHSSASIEFLV